ncbi:MAG: hypothetical protein AAGC77_00010 [Pseudomonadota bacterium]
MTLIENIGAPLNRIATQHVAIPQKAGHAPTVRRFDLNFERLAGLGCYHPALGDAPLALELRAVKRRLLRRLGYLRAASPRRGAIRSGRRRNVILTTSTRAGEGKTFTALNLALSLAIEDQIETLLIDADAPRPKVRQALNLPQERGLLNRLVNPLLSVNGLLRRASEAPLSVLCAGDVDATVRARAADLYAGDEFARVMANLSAAAPDRLIILDAPPALAAPDAVLLAKQADEIIFVVEANQTPEPAVASALDELLDVNPNVSLILNRCAIGAGGPQYRAYERYDEQLGDDAIRENSLTRVDRKKGDLSNA